MDIDRIIAEMITTNNEAFRTNDTQLAKENIKIAKADLLAWRDEEVRKYLEQWTDAAKQQLEYFEGNENKALVDFIDLMETNLEELNGR